MINRIDDNLFQQFSGPSPTDSSGKSKADLAKGPVETSVASQKLISLAKQAGSEDASAVTEARKLLQSGQLDSPENIRKAAENILKFGL